MSDTAASAAPAPQVSPDNPCPFLRALVAGNYVGGHIVPLPQLTATIDRATGKTGLAALSAGAKIFMVAQMANGISPFSQMRSLLQGAILDQLRNGPLDKHGAGSRILDQHAVVHEDEIARLATFGSDYKASDGSVERGLSAAEITGVGFDAYAIGGLSVGERGDEMLATVELMDELLPGDRQRGLSCSGRP